jgi:hypothetical protein
MFLLQASDKRVRNHPIVGRFRDTRCKVRMKCVEIEKHNQDERFGVELPERLNLKL